MTDPIVADARLQTGAAPFPSPLVTRERFSEMVGVTPDTVNKWIDRGFLPVFRVGRWSLVNVALLNARCLEKEFEALQ